MLTAAVDHGTGRAARNVAPGTALAGKTGTSRDGWFVGYTPNLVCVVWIGFDDNRQLGLTGANAALPAWSEFVGAAVKLRPELGGRNFECPEGVKFVEIDSENGLISTVTCPHRELIAVTERSSPNLECYLHGNLPELFQEPEEGTYDDGVVVASRKPLKQEPSLPSRHTRVDIDTSGKRTLMNEILIR
jgi:penicillin-binding protein 1B